MDAFLEAGVPKKYGPSRKSRLGRESSRSRETSLEWEGRLCTESWLGIPYSIRCIYHGPGASLLHNNSTDRTGDKK